MSSKISVTNGNPKESGVIVLTIAFEDENGDPITPTAAVWSLHDWEKAIVNDREDVAISSLDTSVEIVLSGDDLDLGASDNGLRYFSCAYTYVSDLGTLTDIVDGYFQIDDVIGR